MHSDERFVGRDRELGQLRLAIGPGTDGLRLAMLSGPSGLGKSTLAKVASRAAADAGFRVATVQGRAGALSTPFAPFMHAMPELEVLLSVLAGDRTIDLEHAGIGLVNLVAELTVDRPLLLAFDDAQALDESSLALLPYLIGIAERANLTILFIEQTDAVGVPSSYRSFIDGVLARRVVNHLQLQPMDDDSVRELVAHQLGMEDVAEVPGEIVLRAGGNPWFAKELAEAWRSGASEIPTNIAAAATARLHSLDEVGQDVVSAVALCDEGAHIGWLEAMSGQRPRQFVRTMEAIAASGLVREDAELVSIAHPLMQQALVDELSSAMRRAIHMELADVIAQVPLSEVVSARARAQHLSAAGRTDEAVQLYLRAADANSIAGQLHEAYADLRHALGTETQVQSQIELLRRAATVAMQLGLQDAIAHWTELGRVAAATGNDELYAYALYQQYWACNDGTANERLHRAATLGTGALGWSARAAATLARMDGDFERAAQLDERAIEIARASGDEQLEALALAKLAASQADLGRSTEAIVSYREAVRRAISARLHDWAIISWGELVATLLEDLETRSALDEIDAAIQYANDLALERMLPALLAWRGHVLARAGELEAASADIEQSLALDLQFHEHSSYRNDHWTVLVRMAHAAIANEIGRSDALSLARDAFQLSKSLGYASWGNELVYERARATYRGEGLPAALTVLDEFDAAAEPVLTATAAAWLARVGVIDAAPSAVEMARKLYAAVDVALPNRLLELQCAEVDALLEVVDGGSIAALEAVSVRWADAGRALDALRVQVVTGSHTLAKGDREAARTILDAARRGLNDCGASADADRAAALLRQTGARSRAKSRTTTVGPLTKRELEIARLVASGLKNSEVAGTLFLAEKTVAAHLSNIYGKVEVRSRVQLTGWIRENDPEFEATLASAG
ncbi:MAG: ATPase-like protein [Thermoleophilia bacterium]|nr:ATPase-like protein [Thermoleophilia bacterium]